MNNLFYISTNQLFWIIQSIPDSVTGDTVTIEIKRLSTGYTWHFTNLAFQSGSYTGNMTFISDILWKQSFTPPANDTYIVTVTDSTLDVKFVQVLVAVGAPSSEGILEATLTSTTEICNMALAHLGQKPIVTINDTTNENARALERIYKQTRDTVLRAKDWKFAGVKEELAEVADQDIPGWEYVYAVPAKCLRIRKIFSDIESQDPAKLEYEEILIPALNQKVIVTNEPDCYIEYTYQVIDPALYDATFCMAFSFLLAAQIAKPLTKNDDTAIKMMQIYGSMVSDAGRINDTEGYKKPNETSSFEDAR